MSSTYSVRARDVVWFNWPTFASGVVAVALGVLVIAFARPPDLIRIGIGVAAAGAAYLLVASTVAAWWVFERSDLTSWRWLPVLLPPGSGRWVNITTGFDDTSAALASLLSPAEGVTVDVFDTGRQHVGSLLRARHLLPPAQGVLRTPTATLPLDAASTDAVLLLMAAHEIRDVGERRLLFGEVARVLRPGGRLVLVEHLQDIRNALAFGPGFLHFVRRSAWLAIASGAGLRLVDERRMTPFVAVFVLERPATADPA